MCFLDITGYTRLTSERGDEAAAQLASTFSRMVQRTSHQYAGKAVKWLGDGVECSTSPIPVPAWSRPWTWSKGPPMPGCRRPCRPPRRSVLIQDGDYFGATVNLAARIADYARPGEVLVSQSVVDAAGEVPAAFSEIGPVELKGVSGDPASTSPRRNRCSSV